MAPGLLKRVKALKRTFNGDLPEDVQSLQSLLASLATRVERLWRHGLNGLWDADVDLQNQAAKMKMLEVIYRYAGDLATHSKVRASAIGAAFSVLIFAGDIDETPCALE